MFKTSFVARDLSSAPHVPLALLSSEYCVKSRVTHGTRRFRQLTRGRRTHGRSDAVDVTYTSYTLRGPLAGSLTTYHTMRNASRSP